MYEEQRKLVQQQAQTKAQMARYEDELTRKRMQVTVECGCQFIYHTIGGGEVRSMLSSLLMQIM